MSACEWMASWVLNGLLPIHEAAERIGGAILSNVCYDEDDETVLPLKPKRYTVSDEARSYIAKRYPYETAKVIAEVLGMNSGSVMTIANRMGVRKEQVTAEQKRANILAAQTAYNRKRDRLAYDRERRAKQVAA